PQPTFQSLPAPLPVVLWAPGGKSNAPWLRHRNVPVSLHGSPPLRATATGKCKLFSAPMTRFPGKSAPYGKISITGNFRLDNNTLFWHHTQVGISVPSKNKGQYLAAFPEPAGAGRPSEAR
ncbi:MAG: hypothetical protein R6V03_08670, partial [Kiritimatiellia bacterium]